MNNTGYSKHAIAGAFVFMLLGVFAVMSMVLVLFGVKAYRNSVMRSDRGNEERLLSFYLRSMLRSVDEKDVVGTETISGVDTLFYTENYDGVEYVTRIYSWDGNLREWFSESENAFKPEDGEILFPAGSFEAEIHDGLMTANLTGTLSDDPITVMHRLYAA